MTQPKYQIKQFVFMNENKLQVLARVYNPYVRTWQYNLRNGKGVLIEIPESLIN